MREACRQADKVKAIEPAAALSDKAMEAFHDFSQRLTDSYNELEQAISNKVRAKERQIILGSLERDQQVNQQTRHIPILIQRMGL